MREHHKLTIERLREHFQDDPRYPALIAGGSVMKGLAMDTSDVDVIFIASEEEWQRHLEEQKFFYFTTDFCDYPGGYVDGKFVNLQFLLDVADHGSEPARFAFQNTQIIYSHIPGLEDILQQIPVYPEKEQQNKILSFYTQVVALADFFIPEAEKRNQTYLLQKSAADLALYSGRLILAYNKILFPSHKWYMKFLADAPNKPDNFLELIEQLLQNPTHETAQALLHCINSFHDWNVSFEQIWSCYLWDSEWNWRHGKPPLQDW